MTPRSGCLLCALSLEPVVGVELTTVTVVKAVHVDTGTVNAVLVAKPLTPRGPRLGLAHESLARRHPRSFSPRLLGSGKSHWQVEQLMHFHHTPNSAQVLTRAS